MGGEGVGKGLGGVCIEDVRVLMLSGLLVGMETTI